MVLTSISKLSNCTYLSQAFQLNNSYFRAGPPCLGLRDSQRLAVFVVDLSPASASLSAIITAVAA